MRLQRLFFVTASILGILGLIAAAALMAATSRMRDHSERIARSLVSVRATEEIAVHLLTHDRERRLLEITGDALHRGNLSSAREQLHEALAIARNNVSGAGEARLLAQTERAIGAYFEAADGGEGPETRRRRLDAALGSSTQLIDLNLAQADAEESAARSVDAMANVGGAVFSGLLLLAVAGSFAALRSRVFSPLLSLRRSLAGLQSGTRHVEVEPEAVAEIQAVAREFNEMALQLRRQEQAQVRFLSGVAHDLRNPIQALKLSASALTRRDELPAPEKIRRTLQLVIDQSERLDRMVGDLLDRTRVEAGNLELQKSPTDLLALAASAIELHQETSRRHRLRLQPQVDLLEADCDPLRVSQVLNNLLSNAIKYSPNGGEVLLTVRRDGDQAVLEVSDQGLGIPEEELARIFEPFHRSRLQPTEIPGVGLGLSVSRRIVEAHGGRIEVESTLGLGSRFRVRLPALPDERRVEPH